MRGRVNFQETRQQAGGRRQKAGGRRKETRQQAKGKDERREGNFDTETRRGSI